MNQTNEVQPHNAAHAEFVMPVKYRSYRNDPNFQINFNVGRSRDISVEGLLLAVGKHNPVNATLDMEVELPDGLSAYVIGKVTETVDSLVNGVMYHFDRINFLKLDKEAEDMISKKILEYIRKKGRRP